MKDTHSDQAQLGPGTDTHNPKHTHIQLDLARNHGRILGKKLYYYNQVYDCNSATLLECQ